MNDVSAQGVAEPRASLGGYLLWALICLLGRLPTRFMPALASLAALCRRLVARRSYRVLQKNIHAIWGLPPQSSFTRSFARQVLYHQSLIGLESIKGLTRENALEFEGLESFATLIKEAESCGRGQIMISAHLGSWEFISQVAAELADQTFHALAKPSRSQSLSFALDRLRKETRAKILWTSGRSGLRRMLKALGQGEWLGFVMDQKPLKRQGPLVTFFGRPTEFVAGPAEMAIKNARPVLAVFCVRVAPMRYRLLSSQVLPAGHDVSDVRELSQLLASEIERAIRLYPEQWCWDYRRWRF